MSMKHSILPLALLSAMTLLAACRSDTPTGGNSTPAGCDGSRTFPSTDGFYISGNGYSSVPVDLADSAVSDQLSQTQFTSSRVEVSTSGDLHIAGDSLYTLVTLRFPSKVGTYEWVGGSDGASVSITLEGGPSKGAFGSVSGRTTVSNLYMSQDSDAVVGTFCGTLRDSSGRTITVEGGRFRY
jgi:hypothetical protein